MPKVLSAALVLISLLIGTSIETFGIKPDRVYRAKPDDYGIKYREHKIPVGANEFVLSWELPPLDSTKAATAPLIILVGTDAGNMSNSIFYAAKLLNQEFRVVMFDYRGFGESSPKLYDTTYFYDEGMEADLKVVVQHFNKTYANISLMGLSFGTLVIQSALASLNLPINSLIFDSPILDKCTFYTNLKVKKPFFKDDFKICKYSNTGIKTLVIYGLADNVTNLETVDSYAKENDNIFLVAANCSHLQTAQKLGDIYFNSIYAITQKE